MPYTNSQIYPDDRRGMVKVRALLEGEGLSLDANLDYTCGLFDEEYRLAATGSAFGATLRCFAVAREHQGEGLLNQVISHLIEYQAQRGVFHLFVYTKCASAKFFADLGFYEIARTDGQTVFMENRRDGFRRFCAKLAESRQEGRSAAVVMNANPFTLGHQYLVERAAAENDTVHLFVLSEEAGPIPFAVRSRLVREGVAHLPNVICHASGPYIISAATFPSYFLRDDETVIRTHARLDLTLFRSIAQVLGISARYVGEEPSSRVTALYNQLMIRHLPESGIKCHVIHRLEMGGRIVSASAVRQAIQDGQLEAIRPWVPESTWNYFQSPQAEPVIRAIQGMKDVVHY